jgi:site-specific DNA recombinase
MTRCSLYLRYSSSALQTETSLLDQERICRAYAERQGWTVTAVYSDAGISGESLLLRPGIQRMMADAEAGLFDVLLVEAQDRVARDMSDAALTFKELKFFGVKLYSISDGEVDEIKLGMRATIDNVYLRDLGRKTYRGQEGVALSGRCAGGLAYGYSVVKKLDGNGNPIRGLRQINSVEAPIVIRIFDEYRRGISPRAIAGSLNKDGIPGPRGRVWSATTINGSRKKGLGILNASIYVGLMQWGRQKWVKNPRTGRRVSRMNADGPSVTVEVESLRIVPQDLWLAVKAQQDAIERKPTLNYKKRPPKLLSYLLRCGDCGSGCSLISATHYGCSAARNSSTCSNRLSFHREKLEELVIGAFRSKLMNVRRCEIFCQEYVEHSNWLRMQNDAERHRRQAELAQAEAEIANLMQALKAGCDASLVKDELNGLQERRVALSAALEADEGTPVLIHPRMAQYYHAAIQRLIAALNEPSKREEAAQLLRMLIEKITLTPNEERSALVVDLTGDAANILRIAASRSPGMNANELLRLSRTPSEEIEQVKAIAGISYARNESAPLRGQATLVAGVGFEPTTFRL